MNIYTYICMHVCMSVCTHTCMHMPAVQRHVWSEDSLQEAVLSFHHPAPEFELRPLDLVTSALTH